MISKPKMSTHDENEHPSKRTLETAAFVPAADNILSETDRRHLRGCAVCTGEVNRLRDARDAFNAANPPAAFFASLGSQDELKRKSRPSTSAFFTARRAAIVGIAAVFLLVVFSLSLANDAEKRSAPDFGISLKGNAATSISLALYVSRDGAAALPWVKHSPFRPGDILRFGVRSEQAGYVEIVNLDDRGRTTVYFPREDSPPTRVEAGKAILLDGSIVLDDFIGDEMIFVFVTPTPGTSTDLSKIIESAFSRADSQFDRMSIDHMEGAVSSTRITKVPK